MKTPNKRKHNPHAKASSPEEQPRSPMPEGERSVQPAPHFIEFIANLEHTFRTPLTIIKGATSMLLRQGHTTLSSDQREALQMIQDAEARLEVLVNHLIDLTQLENGLLALNYPLIDLAALARQVLTSTQQHLPETLQERFRFALHVRDQQEQPGQETVLVPGDVSSLRKVLQHVLDNAIRFSPQGGSIDIIMGRAPLAAVPSPLQLPLPACPCIELCVCDYGMGIPEEHLERIFDRFYQIDRSLTRQGSGLGLGLTLCRLLLELHQGHIWAESCIAGGSAFHIVLPLEQAPTVA